MRAASVGNYLLIFCFIVATVAKYGVDIKSPCDPACFKCLKKNHDADFFIGHLIGSHSGTFDTNGASNIVNAIKAHYSIVEGYIYPCLKKGCPNATQQVRNAVDGLGRTSKFLKPCRIWVDVENYDTKNLWPNDKTYNQAFIRNMTNELQRLGRPTGIYTSENSWAAVVGPRWTEMANLPLWWSTANGYEDLRLFVPFNGWNNKSVEYHQYKIGQHFTECSSTAEIDLDWKPCPEDWTFVRKARRCLRVVGERMSWVAGRAQCQQWGGELVSVHSAEANAAVVGFAYNASGFDSSDWSWFNVGLQRSDASSQWAWTDGTPVDYTGDWCGDPCGDGSDGVLAAVAVFGGNSPQPEWNGLWSTAKSDDEIQWPAICQQ